MASEAAIPLSTGTYSSGARVEITPLITPKLIIVYGVIVYGGGGGGWGGGVKRCKIWGLKGGNRENFGYQPHQLSPRRCKIGG